MSQGEGGGRPEKPIDERQVRELARIQCTMPEIAAVCGCSIDTLERRFAAIIKEAQEDGKSSLRRAQYKVATETENPTMLIWLGKTILGQKDQSAIAEKQAEAQASSEAIHRLLDHDKPLPNK